MEGFMSNGLRKGAWTEEEDNLLRECILNFGEGRWHQVPMRAGLNRCRKGCRLRWLNYLKPNIKRGEFKEDEVDLILKLHKLLGNRWSLIAGRLPGRTANDIKNYWNTHINKKKYHQQQQRKNKMKILIGKNVNPAFGAKQKGSSDSSNHNVVKTTVFKPRPRTFSKTSLWGWNDNDKDNDNEKKNVMKDQYTCSEIQNNISLMKKDVHESDKWWEGFLFDKEEGAHDHEKCVYGNWWESLLYDDKEEENEVGEGDFQFGL